jgi:hypothetical protein
VEDLNINKVGDIDVLFSLVGWSIEGINPTPNNQKANDDRWYTKPAPLLILQLVSPWRLEERENDGLVTGDMADAIIRRITKRRKHRRRRKRSARRGAMVTLR